MRPDRTFAPAGRWDPRLYQIGCLAGLLIWGFTALDFDVTPLRAAVILAVALATQYAGTRWTRLPAFDPRSALISALSLCLLLRTNQLRWAVAAAVIAVGSKFVLRARGKHLMNPTNFGIVALLVLGAPVWVSPGQWGHAALFAFLMACLGSVVVTRAARADVTFAFLAGYAAVLFGRALWLGQPTATPLHQMTNGSLLLFAFFMISDPKTTPDSRAGRVLFALLAAAGVGFVQFGLFHTNGLLWSLAAWSLAVPVIDRLLPGPRYAWRPADSIRPRPDAQESPMRPKTSHPATAAALGLCFIALATATTASAFCGFYVAQADAKLFNKVSQVAIAHDGDRTVVTMSNDYQGTLKEFAIVIPVPTVLEKDQVHIGERRLLDHLDAFSAPRLVEYHDPPPCAMADERAADRAMMGAMKLTGGARAASVAQEMGVTIEAQYTVGEYDILILSARESAGLMRWLTSNRYRVPLRAERVMGAYIRQGLKFFVAKVNLKEQAKLGISYLRPIQIAYESPRFMLPIRLGMANANDSQELFVYTLTPRGRVETVNYRTVKLATDAEVPLFVKAEFGDFYRALFGEQVRRTGMNAVILEYAWNASSCDPCAAPPLDTQELRDLGASWLGEDGRRDGRPQSAFVTRLHARYDVAHFPEDLVFQETANQENFQGRYILRHPWKGEAGCPEAERYREELRQRRAKQFDNVVDLTGWTRASVARRMGQGDDAYVPAMAIPQKWWQKLWTR